MPHAKLSISVPDSIWIGAVTRNHPETRFRVQAATATDEDGVARVDVVGPDAEEVCAEIEEYDTVTDLTVFEAQSNHRSVQIETTVPLIMQTLQQSGVPLDPPVEIVDGELTLEPTIPQKSLSELGETFDALDIPYTVEWVRQEVASDSVLTDRQQWLLDAAIDLGYYDTPRRTSLVELAEELDIAKSTCSEMLHRAEERVMKDFVADQHERTRAVVANAD